MRSTSKTPQEAQRASTAESDDLAQAMLSRSIGLPSWMGKATFTVKTLVPDSVGDELTRVARESGMTVSDFLRDMILVRLYGVEQVSSMQRQRLEVASGIRTKSDAL